LNTTGDTAGPDGATDPTDLDGPAAPPRSNGELVFDAPWQSRMFATTMRLHQSGRIDWETFRQGLITQIGIHEASIGADTGAYDYWGCWQRALEDLLNAEQLVPAEDLSSMATELAERPAGHDHDHDHDHSHDHSATNPG
jgi:nitrile hydratase accessory protein